MHTHAHSDEVTVPKDGPPAEPVRTGLSWLNLIKDTLRASTTDRVSLAAAGCAFYATLALFPAISMLISVIGMVLDPVTAEQQLDVLSGLLPPPAFSLIADRVHQLVAQSGGNLSAHLLVSFLLAFWSSSTGSKSVLSAVNVAYDVTEQRPFLRFQAIGLSMTLVAVICAIAGDRGAAAAGPGDRFPRPVAARRRPDQRGRHGDDDRFLRRRHRAAVSFGPSRPPPPRPRIVPGAALATVLWLIASEVLSFYVSRMASFGATYGSLAAVIGVMMWFYLSAYAVLLGAELNARLEETNSRG